MCVCWCQVEPNKSESGAVLPTFVNNHIKKEVAFFCSPSAPLPEKTQDTDRSAKSFGCHGSSSPSVCTYFLLKHSNNDAFAANSIVCHLLHRCIIKGFITLIVVAGK